MLLIACLPPLRFQIIAVSHYDSDLTRANLPPSRRDALMRRWMTRTPYKKRDATTPTSSAAAAANAVAPVAASRFQCPNFAMRDKDDFRPLAAVGAGESARIAA